MPDNASNDSHDSNFANQVAPADQDDSNIPISGTDGSNDEPDVQPVAPIVINLPVIIQQDEEEPLSKKEQVGAILSAARKSHAAWAPLAERTQEALHRMIGCVREQGALIDADDELKFILYEQVNTNKQLPRRWRKQAKNTPAAKTILAMLFGLGKDWAGKRSQYHAAMRAADIQGIEYTEEACAIWLAIEGGVKGVRTYLPKRDRSAKTKRSLDDVGADLTKYHESAENHRISLPDEVKFRAGWSLFLVKEPHPEDDSGEADIIAIDYEDLLREAIRRTVDLEDGNAARQSVQRYAWPSSRKRARNPITERPKHMWDSADRHDAGNLKPFFHSAKIQVDLKKDVPWT